MIHDCISINSHVILPAGVDHLPQGLIVSHSGVQPVAGGLVQPVPRVELAVLGVVEIQNRFLGWEDFNAEISGFPDHLALLLDLVVGPAEHLDDGSFLSVLVVRWGIHCRMVPDEINRIQHQSRM